MDPHAMQPFGKALLAYLDGDDLAELLVRRDDGTESTLPVNHFFRSEADFDEVERVAVERCRGRVLDVGAGAGAVTRVLEGRGLPVTALDISPEALEVARRRGVRDTVHADVLAYGGGPFDTVLMLGHGIGMVETLAGLDRLLAHVPSLLNEGGQLLVDSLDVRVTDDPDDLRYHEHNRRTGRYVGETRMQLAFRGETGPFCGWLHADAGTLAGHAREAGWRVEVLVEGERGGYLARLTRPGGA